MSSQNSEDHLTPGATYTLGAGRETFHVLGCSDLDSTADRWSVDYDVDALDGTLTVHEGPTADTRILRVQSIHANQTDATTKTMKTQFTIHL